MWGTGLNLYGGLGINSTISTATLTQIGTAFNWKQVASEYFTLALKTAIRWAKMPYDLMNNSCTTIVQAGLISAGILNIKNYNLIPNQSFKIMSQLKYKPTY